MPKWSDEKRPRRCGHAVAIVASEVPARSVAAQRAELRRLAADAVRAVARKERVRATFCCYGPGPVVPHSPGHRGGGQR